MLRSTLRLALVALILLAGIASADPATLFDDMVAFDRVYIPALAMTSQGKERPSLKAIAQLKEAWTTFQEAHSGDYPDDPEWKRDFKAIDDRLFESTMFTSPDWTHLAHNALEPIRDRMREMRLRHDIDYYVDYLTAFHEPMETIVLAGKDKTTQTFTEDDLATIKKTIPQAEKLWAEVQAAPFEAGRYGFSPAKAKQVADQVEKEAQALAALNKAVAAGDTAAIIQRAVAMKPNFAKLFMMFGDFEGLGVE